MKKFKIGMPSLIELTSFDDTVDLCRELDLDFIELNMNLPSNFINNLSPEKIRESKNNFDIDFTMHMPDDADMGVFFESVRDGYIKLGIDTMKWAHKAGVELLNFHIIQGAKMTLPDKKVYIYDQYSDVFINNFYDSFKRLSELTHKYNVFLNIENSGNFNSEFAQKSIDKVLKLKNTGITWDIGHDSANKYIDHDYLMKKVSHITHMHFHDTLGEQDHMIPFSGELDIEDRINFAKDNNISMLIEVKTVDALKKSVRILKERNLI